MWGSVGAPQQLATSRGTCACMDGDVENSVGAGGIAPMEPLGLEAGGARAEKGDIDSWGAVARSWSRGPGGELPNTPEVGPNAPVPPEP